VDTGAYAGADIGAAVDDGAVNPPTEVGCIAAFGGGDCACTDEDGLP
jgi:hypothetical protein